MRALLDIRFVRFLLVGVLNTLFGYSIFALFLYARLHYAVAALLSTVAGVLFNFQTTGRLVFASRDNSLILRFFAVYAITYVIGVAGIRLSGEYQWTPLEAAAAMLPLTATLSYVLNRFWVFPVTA